MFQKVQIVDCRGHVLGRLASVVAKELLAGQRVVLVRCEEVVINGPLFRNKMKYLAFLRKKSNSNPRRCSHIHHRSPSKIVKRTIRGMIRHKLPRGHEALSRLKVYEGIPPPYDQKLRVVVPDALRVMKILPERKTTRLGDLSSQVGWKYDDVIAKLETRRISEAQTKFEDRVAASKKKEAVMEKAKASLSAAEKAILAEFTV